PFGGRWYLGGPSLASAAFTVFREIPSTRAICAIGICSARRSRRISAQSSTLSTCFLPGSATSQGLGEAGQFSVAAQWSVFSCRRQRERALPSLTPPDRRLAGLLVLLLWPVAKRRLAGSVRCARPMHIWYLHCRASTATGSRAHAGPRNGG